MRQKILWIAMFLLSIQFASAELLINPSGFQGTVFVNQQTTAEINLTNTFNYTIYNINFSSLPDANIPILAQLNPNETKTINITILTTTPYSEKTSNSVVRFSYLTAINVESKGYFINITNAGFIPQSINIKRGDYINFSNNGNLDAVIVDQYNHRYFDNIVAVNQTITISNFNQVDNFTYFDLNDLTKIGRIAVLSAQEDLVTNPADNKIFTLTITSQMLQSELGLEVFPAPNTTVEYNSFQELNLRVFNKGQNQVSNVRLSVNQLPEWFSFDDNNFSLSADQNRLIKLRITPIINRSEDTNKTYSITVTASSDNTASVSTGIDLFVPFSEEIFRTFFGADFWEAKEKFCVKFPNALECNPPPKIEERIVLQYVNSTIEFDKEDAIKNFREINTKMEGTETNVEKNTKSINDITEMMGRFEQILKDINSTAAEAKINAAESEKGFLTSTNNVLIILLTITLLGLIGYAGWRAKKKKDVNTSWEFAG